MASVPFKVFVQTESSSEQLENTKNTRKSSRTLAVLQKTAGENLVGRKPAYITKEKLLKKTVASEIFETPDTKRTNPIETASTSSQTGSPQVDGNKKDEITYEDLTSDRPSENYWRVLTMKREDALTETKAENQQLIERIATLECKLRQSKERLAEVKSLADVLNELLEEKDHDQSAQPDVSAEDNLSL